MTYYGMPFFLEDRTGRLSGSEFVDLHDRLRFSYRCTAQDTTHTSYMVFDNTDGRSNKPVSVLDFGPDGGWGTVMYFDGSNPGTHLSMKKYLRKTSILGSTKQRKFTASDGKEYEWKWKDTEGICREWVCSNAEGEDVASYNLKLEGEPEYENSSGCMLTVEEKYPHLVVEMLTSNLIMRHIVESNLS